MNTPKPPSSNANLPNDISLLTIARMLWKRKWLILGVFVLGCAVSVVYVKSMPALYEAQATILVDSQKIPERYVSSTVSTDAGERLNYVREQILSSRRLVAVLSEFKLFSDDQLQRTPEEFAERIRKDVKVTSDKTTSGDNKAPSVIHLSFQSRNQSVVANVVNRIANLFIEENMKTREVMAEGTAEFIDSQLKDAKSHLDSLETTLSQFKMQFNGELPEQQGQISSALSRLQIALEANRDAINRDGQTISSLENTISMAEAEERIRNQAVEVQNGALRQDATGRLIRPSAPGQPAAVAQRPSEVIAQQLADLRLKYRDGHPEIKRLQAVLEQARQQEAAQPPPPAPVSAAATPEPENPAPNSGAVTALELNRLSSEASALRNQDRVAGLRTQIAQAKQDMEKRTADQDKIVKDIAVYQNRIERLPVREQQLIQLSRDYEVSKSTYQSLLGKKVNADMATDLERRQKSERFMLIEPAHVPDAPIAPNRSLLTLLGCGASLVLALVIGLGLEAQKGVLLGDWELPGSTVVLAQLPPIDIGDSHGLLGMFRRLGKANTSGAAGVLIAAIYSGFHYFFGR